MTVQFMTSLDRLKRDLLSLASLVEEQLAQAVEALHKASRSQADAVIDRDADVDRTEVEIEEDCLKNLVLYQPVARDLRFVVSVLKINNDLEKIGDYAVNIAERARFLATQATSQVNVDFSAMERTVASMVRRSVDAFMEQSSTKALEVIELEKEVDRVHRANLATLKKLMTAKSELVEICFEFLSVSRYLERVADLSKSIAEDVIYMVNGEIIRHQLRIASIK